METTILASFASYDNESLVYGNYFQACVFIRLLIIIVIIEIISDFN